MFYLSIDVAKIFVSYASTSKDITEIVVTDLGELGHDVWFDHKLKGARKWWNQILERIRACEIFVFVLDPESVDSLACRREYEYAHDLGKPILPILVSDAVPTGTLPPALSEIHFVDYRDAEAKDAAFSLASALSDIPPAGPLPDPLPVPPNAPVSPLAAPSQRLANTESLSFEEQREILFDLKFLLQQPKLYDGATLLLLKLKRRMETAGYIVREIDEALGNSLTSSQGETARAPKLVPERTGRQTPGGLSQASEVDLPPTHTNSIGMEFVLIPPGTFEMGSEDGRVDEGPVHTVEISKPFYLGRTVVTQAHWEAVMETPPWKGEEYVKEGPDFPATCVSWNDAQEFAMALSKREPGKTYRLPTEAEWEYAARAGEGDEYGRNLLRVAWYKENAWDKGEQYAHRVAEREPNAWGLFDMLGNTWEWVEDRYAEDYYSVSPRADPRGPNGGVRVLRGGSFGSLADCARLSYRGRLGPSIRYSDSGAGFRVLLLPFSEL